MTPPIPDKASMRYLLCLFFVMLSATSVQADWRSQAALAILSQDLKLPAQAPDFHSEILQVTSLGERDFAEIRISSENTRLSPWRMLLNGPRGFLLSPAKWPTLLIISGFLSGRQSVNLIADPGPVILAGFDYAYDQSDILHRPDLLAEVIRQTPGQIACSLIWLQRQAFTDSYQLHLMGVSLGTLFAPVSLALTLQWGYHPASTIFAFGGADAGSVVGNALKDLTDESTARQAQDLINGLLTLQDPKLYLSGLKGPFLVIRGTQDQVFPEISGRLLEDLLPEPKTLKALPVGHIDPTKKEIVQMTMNLVIEFIQSLRHTNPAPRPQSFDPLTF